MRGTKERGEQGKRAVQCAPADREETSTDSLACARLMALPRKPDPSP